MSLEELAKACEIDLFCGYFVNGRAQGGVSVSSENLAALGARGLELILDIYAQ